jgi:hypothetical protein
VSKRLLGRGSYVLVFNSAGQLFVSQRSLSKDCYPGCLDVTISGVVNWVRPMYMTVCVSAAGRLLLACVCTPMNADSSASSMHACLTGPEGLRKYSFTLASWMTSGVC